MASMWMMNNMNFSYLVSGSSTNMLCQIIRCFLHMGKGFIEWYQCITTVMKEEANWGDQCWSQAMWQDCQLVDTLSCLGSLQQCFLEKGMLLDRMVWKLFKRSTKHCPKISWTCSPMVLMSRPQSVPCVMLLDMLSWYLMLVHDLVSLPGSQEKWFLSNNVYLYDWRPWRLAMAKWLACIYACQVCSAGILAMIYEWHSQACMHEENATYCWRALPVQECVIFVMHRPYTLGLGTG